MKTAVLVVPVVCKILTDVSEVLPASIIRVIALMVEAVRISDRPDGRSNSKTSVNIYQTRPHRYATQKTTVVILVAVRTRKLTHKFPCQRRCSLTVIQALTTCAKWHVTSD
jgi:hypothetical protein